MWYLIALSDGRDVNDLREKRGNVKEFDVYNLSVAHGKCFMVHELHGTIEVEKIRSDIRMEMRHYYRKQMVSRSKKFVVISGWK